MGATQKQINVGNDVRPATKLHSIWSKRFQFVAAKRVLAPVEDPETRERFTAHLERLAFNSPRLRDELAP